MMAENKQVRNMHRHTDQMVGGTFIRSTPKARSSKWERNILSFGMNQRQQRLCRDRDFVLRKATPLFGLAEHPPEARLYWSHRREQSVYQSIESIKIPPGQQSFCSCDKEIHQTPFFAGIYACLDKHAGSVGRILARDGQVQVTERCKRLPPKT